MLATPPFGASSNIALWRANNKPPVELVVADLDIYDDLCDEVYIFLAQWFEVWGMTEYGNYTVSSTALTAVLLDGSFVF